MIIEGLRSTNVSALIDTGASYTMLPKQLADEIGVRYTGERVQLGGAFAGGSDNAYLAFATLKFPFFDNLTYMPKIAISEKATDILVGMDVLNPLKIVIDSHTGELTIKDEIVDLAKGGLMIVGVGAVAYGIYKLFFDKKE